MIFFSFPDKFSRILFDFRAYLFIKGRSRNGDIKVNMKYNKDLKTLSTDSSLLFDIIACGITKPPISVIPLLRRIFDSIFAIVLNTELCLKETVLFRVDCTIIMLI